MTKFKAMLLSTAAVGVGLTAGVVDPRLDSILRLELGRALAQNPCAPKANPCAAGNPCAPKANPCNPCAGAAAATNSKCVVPRLAQAKANPCAAKRNPCRANPCAAKNPCAGAVRNPCGAANPCAAKNPCAPGANPCNPCGAAAPVQLTDAEAKAVGDCMFEEMLAAYAKAPLGAAKSFKSWTRYSMQPYQSATHGQRFVHNYGNAQARNYGRYEKAGKMPVGAQIAKPSFAVTPEGRASVGPLFVMEKMPAGFLAESGNWKYTMVMPDGTIFGQTKGKNSAGMQFCIGCHQGVRGNDDLFFLPEQYRVSR